MQCSVLIPVISIAAAACCCSSSSDGCCLLLLHRGRGKAFARSHWWYVAFDMAYPCITDVQHLPLAIPHGQAAAAERRIFLLLLQQQQPQRIIIRKGVITTGTSLARTRTVGIQYFTIILVLALSLSLSLSLFLVHPLTTTATAHRCTGQPYSNCFLFLFFCIPPGKQRE